jgi:group I intron endonuclease
MLDGKVIGVYRIKNTVNGKLYIGSSVNCKRRIVQHKNALRNGRHHSRYLQREWNKSGEDTFAFDIIETCASEHVRAVEQVFIEYFESANAQHGYNMCPVAGSCRGTKASDETRRKMSQSARGHSVSEETRSLISAAHTGRKHSDEMRARVSAATKGRKLKPETIAKMVEARRGYKVPEELRSQISRKLMGHYVSEATRLRQSQARYARIRNLNSRQMSLFVEESR